MIKGLYLYFDTNQPGKLRQALNKSPSLHILAQIPFTFTDHLEIAAGAINHG